MASEEGSVRASLARRWLAFVLELLAVPGLGHYLLGSTRHALVWFGALLAPGVASLAAVLAGSRSLFWALFLAHLLGRVLAALDCIRQPARVAPGAWRAAAVVVAVTLAASLCSEYVKASWIQAFHLPSGSMYPLISKGDHIFVGMGTAAPSRGDVVTVMMGGEQGGLHVKRIIALPGDTVAVDGLSVIVNDLPFSQQPVAEACVGMPRCTLWEESNGDLRYTISSDDSVERVAPFGPMTVPDDSVFVMGDNRSNSLDSRHLGPVPLNKVLGTFLMIWLPAAWLGNE